MQVRIPTMFSRREFMAIAGATTWMAKNAFSDVPNERGWIDAHVHVWTPDIKTYPLDKAFKVEDVQPKSFTPVELLAHATPAGVARVVLIQMSFYQFDNRYMLDVIAQHPGVFSGVGIVDHESADLASNMKQLAKKGVRGFRIHAHGDEAAKWVNDDGIATLWKTASEENLAVCPLINPTDLPHIDALCKKFPDTRVVVDHFARIGISGEIVLDQLEQLCGLARFPNVYVKTSAFYALGKKQSPYSDLLPMIRRVVEAFTPQRLMWASDCPFQVQENHTYADSIALIRDRADFLSQEDKQAILQGTAEKVFFS
jgi:predicted TIM-barrel fold metal-dependent hydrolase